MSLLTMSAQLAEGFLITVEIFVLTLLFSLPLWKKRERIVDGRETKSLSLREVVKIKGVMAYNMPSDSRLF